MTQRPDFRQCMGSNAPHRHVETPSLHHTVPAIAGRLWSFSFVTRSPLGASSQNDIIAVYTRANTTLSEL